MKDLVFLHRATNIQEICWFSTILLGRLVEGVFGVSPGRAVALQASRHTSTTDSVIKIGPLYLLPIPLLDHAGLNQTRVIEQGYWQHNFEEHESFAASWQSLWSSHPRQRQSTQNTLIASSVYARIGIWEGVISRQICCPVYESKHQPWRNLSTCVLEKLRLLSFSSDPTPGDCEGWWVLPVVAPHRSSNIPRSACASLPVCLEQPQRVLRSPPQ
ncbi:hypothetical protein B566_EDAN003684 [Ephemera danica]|nr:hypothetical protein B566_EDAN003684 [Ephemera danica]